MKDLENIISQWREINEHSFPKITSWAVMKYYGRELPFYNNNVPPHWKTNFDPFESAWYVLMPETDVPIMTAFGFIYERPFTPFTFEMLPDFQPPKELIVFYENEWGINDESEK